MRGPNNPKLDAVEALRMSVTMSSRQGFASRPEGCTVNQGSSIASIYITDFASHQTMSYQPALNRICGDSRNVKLKACSNAYKGQAFYYKANPLGVDDYLSLLGQPWGEGNETRFISVDILPRLKEAISNGPTAMDRDLSHWFVNAVYIGQHIWGDVALTTTWPNYHLVGITR